MATPPRVVVDDTDSRITYSGEGWFQDYGSLDNIGNQGPVYQHTSHGTDNDAGISFNFEGTSVILYGTYEPIGKPATPDWECFVDGVSIGANKPLDPPQNRAILCGKLGLQGTGHTFSVEIKSFEGTFWFDSLLYTSSQTSLGEAVLLVQNTDPGVLLDSNWESLEDFASITNAKGARARFEFVGKSLTWFGLLPRNQPNAPASGSFSIDGGPATEFELKGLPGDSIVHHYNQPFFTTPELGPGHHSIVVTYNGGDGPATPLTLDYLHVTTTSTNGESSSTAVTTTVGPSQSSSEVPAVSTGTTVASSASSQTSTTYSDSISTSTSTTPGAVSSTTSPETTPGTSIASTPRAQHSSTPISAIVGGSVGGLVLIAVFLCFLFIWKRRRQRHGITAFMGGSGRPGKVTPFTSIAPQTPRSQPSGNFFEDPEPSGEYKSPLSAHPTTGTWQYQRAQPGPLYGGF